MQDRGYFIAGAFLAPLAGIATGIWAEFADLSPPVLLAVTTPAIIVSVLCFTRLTGRSQPLAVVLFGTAMGLVTFALSAGTYIVIHYFASGGFDVNDDESGGSALVFFAVHFGVGMVVGLVIGVGVASTGYALSVIRRRGL